MLYLGKDWSVTPMKCSRCGQEAFVKLKRHNAAFCKECFTIFFERQVEGAIRRKRMFTKDEPVLIGVSGGKDSMALWHYLHKAGYQVTGVHVFLGIGEYSERSRDTVVQFAQAFHLPLEVLDVTDFIGCSFPEASRRLRERAPCSLCGSVKRYILNRFATERGFTVYATGHNLDDEAATLLGNVLHWHIDYLAHQDPHLPSPHPKMTRKVKPFYTLTEEEILHYVALQNIPFVPERCPLSRKAKSLDYKEALALLEAKSPGTKHMFFLGFLEKGKPYFAKEYTPPVLQECERCGMPTTQKVCSFCRILEKLKDREVKSGAHSGRE